MFDWLEDSNGRTRLNWKSLGNPSVRSLVSTIFYELATPIPGKVGVVSGPSHLVIDPADRTENLLYNRHDLARRPFSSILDVESR